MWGFWFAYLPNQKYIAVRQNDIVPQGGNYC